MKIHENKDDESMIARGGISLKRQLLTIAVTAALAVSVGCSDDDDDNNNPTPTPTPTPPPTNQSGDVTTSNGLIVAGPGADSPGLTLYTFDRDRNTVNPNTLAGDSACTTADCLANWPPVYLNDMNVDPVASPLLGSIVRSDGMGTQVTYNGQPLYYFVNDAQAGDVMGDGLAINTWHVISTADDDADGVTNPLDQCNTTGTTPADPVSAAGCSITAEVVVNNGVLVGGGSSSQVGYSLYIFQADIDNAMVDGNGNLLSTCYDIDADPNDGPLDLTGANGDNACATKWPPVLVTDGTANALGLDPAKMGSVQRSAQQNGGVDNQNDGMQVTYNNLPLYYFFQDQNKTDTNGAAIPAWFLAGATLDNDGDGILDSIVDADGDNVIDANIDGTQVDQCLNSPAGSRVTTQGCATVALLNNTGDLGSILVSGDVTQSPNADQAADTRPGAPNGTAGTYAGTSVYVFNNDLAAPGTSTCYDIDTDPNDGPIDVTGNNGDNPCATKWPPVLVSDPNLIAGVAGLGTITRNAVNNGGVDTQFDGLQVTYNGRPLYYFYLDANPGDILGQGAGSVWYLVNAGDGDMDRVDDGADQACFQTPTGEAVNAVGCSTADIQVQTDDVGDTSLAGAVNTSQPGFTLYIYTADIDGSSNCYNDCATSWPPLTLTDMDPSGVDLNGLAIPGLGTTTRTDGSIQLTLGNGVPNQIPQPLYYFANDQAPGDTTGQGASNGQWYKVDGQTFVPTVVGFQTTTP
jgi:predicted lipoprotein with Yx(FWY)xxD motif